MTSFLYKPIIALRSSFVKLPLHYFCSFACALQTFIWHTHSKEIQSVYMQPGGAVRGPVQKAAKPNGANFCTFDG